MVQILVLPCTQPKQFWKLLLPLQVQLFFLNTTELRLFRSGPLFISNTEQSNFFSHTCLNSFNQITFWKIFHWVFQQLKRLTCQVQPQLMFLCWVAWNNVGAAYYDRFHKQALIPSVEPTKLLLNNYKIHCRIKCISLIRVFFFPIIISPRSF